MPDVANGVFKRTGKGGGLLCDPARSFRASPDDVLVPSRLVREFQLIEGAAVTGPVQKKGRKIELTAVESVCGLTPEAYQARTPFASLTAIDPCERFHLAATGNTSMRIVDLIAPIGKGTRGMIVSPPKAGKTILLEEIANAIRADNPEVRIIVLLIDERPEEVTQFRREVEAEVLASSSDQSIQEHVDLVNLALAHARTELECGRDVVVLVDSLTRMGRAFNHGGHGGRGRGRTLSGGLEAGALEIPRRFFGLARNIENGGSVTIIATALVDTGSRMDQLIFEEFKGTGNSEIVLDRKIAEAYIFPAINLASSSTRKEEHLFSPDESCRISKMRRVLADQKPEQAISTLLKLLEKHATNEELLQTIPL
jgi:transcription termination factor Rho